VTIEGDVDATALCVFVKDPNMMSGLPAGSGKSSAISVGLRVSDCRLAVLHEMPLY
jgi:hypothetical protein